jgi:hypothetical protein
MKKNQDITQNKEGKSIVPEASASVEVFSGQNQISNLLSFHKDKYVIPAKNACVCQCQLIN